MPPIPPQLVQLNCPNCQNVVRTEIYSIVDVSQQPELKQTLLSGRLNVAVCPACSAATMIAAPLTYHDPQQQLCFVYIPQELQVGPDEQERIIGEQTNIIIQNLPSDAPRGYLFTPQRFISLPSLIDAILEADGIPREVVEQQRNQIDLMSKLAEAMQNDEQFQKLVEQHQDALNYEFFAMLNAFIDASVQEQQHESAQLLSQLRQKLANVAGISDALDNDNPLLNMDNVLQQMLDASDEELEELIAEVRPNIDYAFFQDLTSRIDALEQAGKTDEAKQLLDCRQRVLDTVERVDKEAQQLFEQSHILLQEVVHAPDPKAVLQSHADQVNEAFMLLLSASIESATREGNNETAALLEQISRYAIEVIQENLPPEERLINELLLAETPQERSRVLNQNTAMVTSDFVKKLNELASEQEKRGVKETATRMRQIAREASAFLF